MRMNPFARNLRFYMPSDERRAEAMILWLRRSFAVLLGIAAVIACALAIYIWLGLQGAFGTPCPITAEHLSPRLVISATGVSLVLLLAALVCHMRAVEIETLRHEARTSDAISLIPAV